MNIAYTTAELTGMVTQIGTDPPIVAIAEATTTTIAPAPSANVGQAKRGLPSPGCGCRRIGIVSDRATSVAAMFGISPPKTASRPPQPASPARHVHATVAWLRPRPRDAASQVRCASRFGDEMVMTVPNSADRSPLQIADDGWTPQGGIAITWASNIRLYF